MVLKFERIVYIDKVVYVCDCKDFKCDEGDMWQGPQRSGARKIYYCSKRNICKNHCNKCGKTVFIEKV